MSPPAGVVDGLLAGRYRLASLLGSGANGEVWRAHDERLGRDVAVKVLRPELADDEDVRARFRAEARHAGRLRHPGIAAVFDFAEHDDGAWLVMELVDGQPLSAVLREHGRLGVDRTLDVVEQAAAALQAAHDGGVVHRDVKPGNLLLRRDGRLSVTDFGIAHAAGAAALTRTGQVVGTASYLSPEQASGAPVRPATDLYALGVVAHECLSGARPFERDDPVAVLLAHLQTPPPPLPDDVPAPVADLVRRLLAKEPADRPASAAQVQQQAAALRRDLAVAAPPTAVLAAPAAAPAAQPSSGRAVLGLAGRPGQRRAVRATALALGLLALALGVRDAVDRDPPRPPAGQEPASTSAPSTPTATPQAPAPTPAGQASTPAPAAVPQDEPASQPAPAQQDDPPAQQDDAPAQQDADVAERQQEQDRTQLEKQQEKQQGRDDKQQEQDDKQQEKEQGGGRG